jgi:AcrR family transcriptional regulator
MPTAADVPTRDRILYASAELFRRQGYAGTGLKQIAAESHAPFGSLYHFLPGGKEELAEEVLRVGGRFFLALYEAIAGAAPDLTSAVRDFFAGAGQTLGATGYADACPIATVAGEIASVGLLDRPRGASSFVVRAAELLRVLPERLVKRAEAHSGAAGERPAGVEVLEPEADRVRRAGLGAERLERADVEDRIVVGKREVEERGRGRDPDALELEQRRDAGRLVARGQGPAGGVDDRGLGVRGDLRAAPNGLPRTHLDELPARVIATRPRGCSDREPRALV